jgi:plasmid replication initiation protein
MLGVPVGKYKLMAHLRSRILDTAFGEVSQLTPIGCAYEMMKMGGKAYTHIRVMWFAKDASASYEAAQNRDKPKVQQKAESEETALILRSADKKGRQLKATRKGDI